MNIAIIDYDIGNVRSIINALERVGVTPVLTRNKDTILNANGVILPGVGAFAHGMKNLKKYDLLDTIYKYTDKGKPFMGICLGMQMLLEESEEFGTTKGIGLIEGRVIKLPIQNKDYEKLPHVSWNEITDQSINWEETILDKIPKNSNMYFVHSFIAITSNENNTLSTTEYSNYRFCSSVKKGNIYGCQFHPEKSGEIGIKVIENFIKICKENNYE